MKQPPKSTGNNERQHRAFFGRVSGKRLHRGQHALFETLLPQLQVNLPEEGTIDPKQLFSKAAKQRIIEIGYGGGEHLARLAEENPETGFVGCEVFTGGIGKMLQKIADNDLKNITLFTEDAFRLLCVLPDASIDGVYLLYPDPWPKPRHHKRRFVSKTTLDELARTIRPGGSSVLPPTSRIMPTGRWPTCCAIRDLTGPCARRGAGTLLFPAGNQPVMKKKPAVRAGPKVTISPSFAGAHKILA